MDWLCAPVRRRSSGCDWLRRAYQGWGLPREAASPRRRGVSAPPAPAIGPVWVGAAPPWGPAWAAGTPPPDPAVEHGRGGQGPLLIHTSPPGPTGEGQGRPPTHTPPWGPARGEDRAVPGLVPLTGGELLRDTAPGARRDVLDGVALAASK